MIDITKIPAGQTYQLVGDVDDSSANPTITITGDDPTLDVGGTLPPELILHLTPEINDDGSTKSEAFYVDTPVDNGDSTYSFSTVYRALKNDVTNNPPQASDSKGVSGYKSHKNGEAVVIDPTISIRSDHNTYTAATTTIDYVAGENISQYNSLSLYTDGKIYKYNYATYPNFIGIADAAISSGSAGTITTFNGLSTGHSGLTIGTKVYAEDTGAITQTASTTTTIIGKAQSATDIRITLAGDADSELTATQVKDDTDTTFGLVSGERLGQFIDDRDDLVRDTGNETIAGVKTFSSSPVVPTPTTDYQASTKKYVDDNVVGIGFSAYINSLVTLGTSYTQIASWGEDVDQGSNFASGTFTAPSAGLYVVSVGLTKEGGIDTLGQIWKNSVSICQIGGITGNRMCQTIVVSLAALDTIKIYGKKNGGNGNIFARGTDATFPI